MLPAPATSESTSLKMISRTDLEGALSIPAAIACLSAALRGELDPEAMLMRTRLETGVGELMIMPSTMGTYSGTKLLSLTPGNPGRGLPAIQGTYLLFAGEEQIPVALLDGIALTNLRTSAVSALVLQSLTCHRPDPLDVTIFGSGPQAHGHLKGVAAVCEIGDLAIVGRDMARLDVLEDAATAIGINTTKYLSSDCEEAVAKADVICCCTAAREPLFSGALVADGALVVAVGSHSRDARELDDGLIERSTVIVESKVAALAEAGEIVSAYEAGLISSESLHTLKDLVGGGVPRDRSRPTVFKSTGMGWQDLALAAQIYRTSTTTPSTDQTGITPCAR